MELGEDFKFLVETATPGTFVEVKGMNSFSTGGSRSESREYVFDEDDPIVTLQSEEDTYAVGGFFKSADPGQLRMLALRATQATTKVQALFDGTNGSEIPCKIRSRQYGAAAQPGSLQTISFELVRDGTVVAEGAGPIV